MKLILAILLILLFKFINTTQINLDEYCPMGYNRIPNTKICILITQNATPHDNLCLSTGSTSTLYYLELILKQNVILIDFLQTNNNAKFWLPIAKDEHDFLVWKLPIPLWNQNIAEMNEVTAPIKFRNGKCAVYDGHTKNMFMDDCHNKYPHLCFYDTTESIVTHTRLCNNTLMGRPSKFHGTCLEIEELAATTTTMNKATVLVNSNDKLWLVNGFIDTIGMKTEAILIAMNDKNVTDKRVTVIQNGVIERVNLSDVRYRIVEATNNDVLSNKKPSIDLSYQADGDTLMVVIKNFQNLWNPLTNGVPFVCYYDTNILNETSAYQVKPMNTSDTTKFFSITLPYYKGAGTVWCDAQMLSTFETITSNRLVLNRNIDLHTKVLCVTIESGNCTMYNNIYSEVLQMRDFTTSFGQEIRDFDYFYVQDVQLKKMIALDVNRSKYLFHIVLESNEIDHIVTHFNVELDNLDLIGYQEIEVRLNDVCSSSNLELFPSVKLNEKSVIRTMCLLDTGLPPAQECIGNLIDGAEWRLEYDTYELLNKKCNPNLVNERTQELFNLNKMLSNLGRDGTDTNKTREIVETTVAFLNKTVTMENNEITNKRYAIETLHNLLKTVSVDIYDENSIAPNETKPMALIEPISKIIDIILDQETNSLIDTEDSKILETIDLMADKIAESNVFTTNPATLNNSTAAVDSTYDDDGVILIPKNNYILMIVNPLIKNITGIALYKIDGRIDEKSFHDFSVRKLRNNDTLPNIYNESLEITAHIPAESFDKIKINRNGVLVSPDRIIFKIYYKNSLFNENGTDNEANGTTETIESESKVIGITIPNYYERELPPGVYTMFKTKPKLIDTKSSDVGCSDILKSAKSLGWNRELWTHKQLGDSVVVCPVRRLANIGFVKLFGNKISSQLPPSIYIDVLHYTTVVGCILSLIGLVLVFVTSLIYRDWRKREATPLILNVSIATFLQLTMFVVAESGVFKNTMECLIIGGILHFVTLAGFFISLFVTDCQYRRYIIVFGSAKAKHFKTKILVFGWIVPLLIVTSCLIFTPNSYIPTKELHELGDICYPTELILYLFVHGPIVLIFCINVCVYVWIIIRLTQENPDLRKTPKKSRVLLQIRLFFFIFFMLSLTWAFGLLAHYMESMIFAGLFNVTGPLQGFCLFIFCVLFDDKTRTFWIQFIFRSKNKA